MAFLSSENPDIRPINSVGTSYQATPNGADAGIPARRIGKDRFSEKDLNNLPHDSVPQVQNITKEEDFNPKKWQSSLLMYASGGLNNTDISTPPVLGKPEVNQQMNLFQDYFTDKILQKDASFKFEGARLDQLKQRGAL